MAKTVGGKEYNEEGLVRKTKRRLKELFHGERTYLPKEKKLSPIKPIPPLKAKPKEKLTVKSAPKTTRTKQIEGGLKQAGLSEADIAKLRGKG